jgi:hypothetical protein
MRLRVGSTTLLLALLATAAHAADVYRSTAPDGTVSYSDRPQGADSEFVSTVSSRAPRTQAPQPAAAAPASPAAAAPAAAAPVAPLPQGPTAAQLRADRQKNCEVARERNERYTLSRRLYRTNADGEKYYLDDAAVAEARAKAAADVEDWCD